MRFVRRSVASPGAISLKIQVTGDEVCASIRLPKPEGPPLRLEHVPLRKAVALAAQLSARNGLEVAVIDPKGLWPPDDPPAREE